MGAKHNITSEGEPELKGIKKVEAVLDWYKNHFKNPDNKVSIHGILVFSHYPRLHTVPQAYHPVAMGEVMPVTMPQFVNSERQFLNLNWMTTIAPFISIVSHSTSSPENPSVTFRIVLQPIHSNGVNGVHGGCTASLFDFCTTLVLHMISYPGFWHHLGVSRTLNVTYLRPVPMGKPVDVECEIMHASKRLATTRGVIRAAAPPGKEKGPVLAICEHGKYNTDPPASSKL
ncbi:HotDog domain-containing protein [Camillea tinctor]|nr:HotDog domain-containing protein [Camillea tinctor]